MTFTPANWQVNQSVTVSAAEDSDGFNGVATLTVSGAGASSVGVNVTENDNDPISVIITESGGNTAIGEGTNNDSYTIRLGSEPTGNVTVAVTPNSQVSVSPGSVTLTPGNWNTPQAITVSAVDDAISEGAHTGTISHSATSGDDAYNGISISGVTASITDNDPQSLVVSPLTLNVAEGGTGVFSVKLGAQPSGNVTVSNNRTAGDSDLNVTGGTSLVFTPANWNSTQNVTVSANEDGDALDGQATITASSPGINSVAVTVNESDNDKAEISVEQPAGTNLTDGIANVSFGLVGVGSTSDLVFTIKNTGQADLTGLGIVIDGANSGDFSIFASPSAPVSGPTGSTTFTVRFTPSADGARSAALHISSNDADENPFDISLSGTGTTAEIEIEQPAGTGLTDGNSEVDFGNSAVGNTQQRVFTVRNTGTGNLTGLAATFAGDDSDLFTAGAFGKTTLAPSETTTVTVSFTPVTSGSFSGILQIASNDSDENPFDVDLVGVGLAPEIEVEQPVNNSLTDGAGQVSFGSMNVGGTTSKTFTIRNTGNQPLTGLLANINGANPGDFSSGSFGATTINPNQSTTVTVNFNPSVAGNRTATLRISNNDPDENPFEIALTGTGTTPEISIEQPVNTEQPDGTGEVDFGSVNATQSVAKTFTIRNSGTGPLSNLALSVDGANAAEFVAANLSATSLAPNATATFTVTFTPDAAGERTAAVHVASDDADENPYDIALTGIGLDPEIAVEEPLNTGLTDGVSSRSIGSANIGKSVTKTFTIRNTGTLNLTGLAATFTGANQAEFTAAAFGNTTVTPGNTTTVTVTFSPTATGNRVATLAIASNDRDENPFEIALTGTGTTPEISIEQPVNTEQPDGTGEVDFGSVNATQSVAKTFTIRNSGTGPLSNLALSVDGANAAEFVAANLSATSLAPNATATFTVTFTPDAAGERTAAIHVASDDADENPYDIALTGIGLDPEIAVEEPLNTGLTDGVSSRSIGSANIGKSVTKTFTIRNTGTLNLTGLAATFTGANQAEFTAAAFGNTTVTPGNTTTVTVTFSPTATGNRVATLAIASNDRDENPFEIALTGTGTTPEISIEQPVNTEQPDGTGEVDFGSVNATQSVAKTFTIRNSGTGPLSNLALSVDGANSGEFVAANLSATSLAPNATATFTVTFTPDAAGERTAAVHVASDDADENPYDIALTGIGLDPEIAVEEPLNTGLTDGVSSRSIGSANIGKSVTKTFTIRNTGTLNLTGLAATFTGANQAEFTAAAFGNTTVTPGNTTTVTVTFSPTATGNRVATLAIASNDRDENPFEIALTGTGTTPEISIEQPVNTEQPDGTGEVDFGSVNATQSVAKTFTIRNSGTGPLSNLALSVDGANAAEFVAANLSATSLAPNATATFTVTFTPDAAGERTAAVHVASDDADENPYDIALTGIGLDPEIAVEEPLNTGLTDGVSSRSIGSANIGKSVTKTFTIRNTGTLNLTGLAATFTGANQAEFTAAAFGNTTVTPGNTTTVTVTFSPTATGNRVATLAIASNDRDENPFEIALTGTGTTPEISIEQPVNTEQPDGTGEVDFGNATPADDITKTFTIRNTGTGPLSDIALNVDGTHSAEFTASNLSSTVVQPDETATFTVTFMPDGAGTRTAAIHVSSDDPDENPYDIDLTGFGLDPEISVEEPALTGLIDGFSSRDFGSTNVGVAVSKTFTIRNVGSVALEDLVAEFSGAHSTDFSAAAFGSTSVEAGGTTTVTVSFTPNATGSRAGTLEISSNDRDESPFEISLTGFGTEPEIAIEDAIEGDLEDGVSSVDFGELNVTQSVTKTFTIRNSGDGPLTGLALAISGANSSDFAPGNLSSTSVAVNSTATFQVVFTPSLRGSRSATIRVTSNDADENPFDIDLTGTGLDPEITVEHAGSGLTSETSIISFGGASGQGNSRRIVTIRNTGNADLTGLDASFSGTNPADFSIGSFGATILAPNETTTATITFSPGALGERSGSIEITSNDRDENPFVVSLAGAGVRIDSPDTAGIVPDGVATAFTVEAAGNYAGLALDTEDDPAGWFSAKKIRSNGAFTAKFTANGVSQAIRGIFDPATGTFSSVVTNRAGTVFTSNIGLETTASGRQIAGTIDVDGEVFTIRATQSSFHKTRNPAPWAGRYTFVLPSEPQADGAIQPLGDGYATGSIATSGIVKIAGRLGDGTKLSLATVAGADGTLQVFRNIYRTKPKGLIGGTLFIRDTENISEVDGVLKWEKFADTREKLYPAGFDLDQPAIGSLFSAPFRGERVLSTLSDGADNATIKIKEGNIPQLPELNFTWNSSNRLVYTRTGTENLKLKVSSKTGIFSGSYVDKATGHNLKLAGVALQSQQTASGYFVGNGQTGFVQIVSATAPAIEVRDFQTNTLLVPESTSQFGDAGFEGGSAERSYLVTNAGDGDLILNKPAKLMQQNSNFAVIAATGGTLKPGESALLKILFQPTAAGIQEDVISIFSNDRGNNPLTFKLTGNGISGSLATVAGGQGDFTGTTPNTPASEIDVNTALPDVFPKSTFTGIVMEDATGQPQVGYLSLKLSRGGLSAFSASYQHDDGKKYSFKNTFDPADGTASGNVLKPNGEQIGYAMQLRTTASTGDLRITGSLTENDRDFFFVLIQNGFDKLNPVAPDLTGRYTMLIPGNSDLGQNYPHGDGAVSLTVSSNGTIKAGGILGDGTGFSHSGVLSRDLEWQLFSFLYRSKPKGSIGGSIIFRDLPGISDFDGVLQWKKHANSREKSFKRGFELTSHAIGSKYLAPARDFTALPALVDAIDNAEFNTNDPGIVPNPGTLPLTWDTRNRLTVQSSGTETVKLSIATGTGVISGGYTDKPNGISSKIRAVVFQKQNLVGGTANSGNSTGSILITPATP